MSARILIVRHGQSTWNAAGRWQGTENPPLSTLGVRQAHHAAAMVGTFDLIASSDLERAFVTATIIADNLGVGPVVTDTDLRERHAGGFQGLTRPEIEERFPGFLADGRRPDDYEDEDVVSSRAAGALGRIAASVGDDGIAFVVSHGGVIGALERVSGARRDGRIPNLGGRWFAVGPGVLRPGEDVLLAEAGEITVPEQI